MSKETKTIQFGGALFKGKCPDCDKPLRPASSLSVNSFMDSVNKGQTPTATGICKEHGKMDVDFVRFEKSLA